MEGGSTQEIGEDKEAQLIEGLKTNNPKVWAQFRREYFVFVTKTAMKRFKKEADLEDIFQEVSIAVLKNISTFEGKSKFTTWLYRITENVIKMKRRAARSRIQTDEEPSQDMGDDDQIDVETLDVLRQRQEIVTKVFAELSEPHRAVMELTIKGREAKEIAAQLGIKKGTVLSRRFYAMAEIRSKIAELYSAGDLEEIMEPDEQMRFEGLYSVVGYIEKMKMADLKKELDAEGGLPGLLRKIESTLIDIAHQVTSNVQQSADWLLLKKNTLRRKLSEKNNDPDDTGTETEKGVISYLKKTIPPALLKTQIEKEGGFFPFLAHLEKIIRIKASSAQTSPQLQGQWLGLKKVEFNDEIVKEIFLDFFAYLNDIGKTDWSPVIFSKWINEVKPEYKNIKTYLRNKYRGDSGDSSQWVMILRDFTNDEQREKYRFAIPRDVLATPPIHGFPIDDKMEEVDFDKNILGSILLLDFDTVHQELARSSGLFPFLEEVKKYIVLKAFNKTGGNIAQAASLLGLKPDSLRLLRIEYEDQTESKTELSTEPLSLISPNSILAAIEASDFEILQAQLTHSGGLPVFLKAMEQIFITKAMAEAQGKITQAARLLGVKKSTLSQRGRRMIEKQQESAHASP